MHIDAHHHSTRTHAAPQFSGSKFHDSDDIKAQLTQAMPALVSELVPHAKRFGTNWRCGDLDGNAGSSLWISKSGRWLDHATNDGGGPIDLIMACLGLDFIQAKDWAAHWLGLSDTATPADHAATDARRQQAQQAQAKANAKAAQDAKRRFEVAKAIWLSGTPVTADNLAGRYLTGRGIVFDRLGDGPLSVMRYVERCPIGSKLDGQVAAALVFKVTCAATNKTAGIQRVFLNADATRNRELGKRRLGSTNTPIIAFHQPEHGALAVGEGMETCLALWTQTDIKAVSCVDAGGMSRLPLIDGVKNLYIFADAGDAGRNAAIALGQRYADAGRWSRAKVAKSDDFLADMGGVV